MRLNEAAGYIPCRRPQLQTSLRCVPDPLHDTGSWSYAYMRCCGLVAVTVGSRSPAPFPILSFPLHSSHHDLATFHANPQHLDIEKPGNLATEDVSPQPTCLPLPFRSRRAYAKVILAIDVGASLGTFLYRQIQDIFLLTQRVRICPYRFCIIFPFIFSDMHESSLAMANLLEHLIPKAKADFPGGFIFGNVAR